MNTKNISIANKYDTSFQLLFELSVQGIFIEDKYGNILDCNQSGYEMFGYEKEEIIGLNISDLVPEDFALVLPKIITEEQTTGNQYIERVNKKKDGTLFATEICTKYTTINGKKCIIAFIHDISSQKKIQKELIDSKKEIEKVLVVRDKFFSIISHDLKSPMQSILGFAELIEQEISTQSDEILLYIDNLKKSANSSYELLENLLNWTICQSKNFTPHKETFFIKPICENNCELFFNLAKKKNIKLNVEIDPCIKINTDKNMLQFIMRNLIINAIKFTKTNGEIHIIVSQNDKATTFIVKDNGIGIDENKIEKILDTNIFYTSVGTANETGTGIGLKTCIEFLKILKSELVIHSKINQGSSFSFSLKHTN